MAVMDIIKVGDPILKQICEKVNISIEKEYIDNLLKNMQDTVIAANGAGIAAPQIGVAKKVILVKDVNEENKFFEMINPGIIWASFDKQYEYEGCLSVCGEDGNPIHERVARYKRIRVMWEDRDGKKHEELIKNPLQSRIIQHEIDHLNGVLFTDRIRLEQKQ